MRRPVRACPRALHRGCSPLLACPTSVSDCFEFDLLDLTMVTCLAYSFGCLHSQSQSSKKRAVLCTHKHVCTYRHARTCMHTHTYARTHHLHACMHTHTHLCAHTQSPGQGKWTHFTLAGPPSPGAMTLLPTAFQTTQNCLGWISSSTLGIRDRHVFLNMHFSSWCLLPILTCGPRLREPETGRRLRKD